MLGKAGAKWGFSREKSLLMTLLNTRSNPFPIATMINTALNAKIVSKYIDASISSEEWACSFISMCNFVVYQQVEDLKALYLRSMDAVAQQFNVQQQHQGWDF